MANRDFEGKTILLKNDTRSYTDREVRNIVIELENAVMYAHSHKIDREQLKNEIEKVKMKYKIFPYGGFDRVDIL